MPKPGPVQKRFGQRVRGLRQAAGWKSQEKFAEACNLHRNYIGSIERGERNVGLTIIERIAEALGLRIADLFSPDLFPGPADNPRSPSRPAVPARHRKHF